jgi:hypothetical protein
VSIGAAEDFLPASAVDRNHDHRFRFLVPYDRARYRTFDRKRRRASVSKR